VTDPISSITGILITAILKTKQGIAKSLFETSKHTLEVMWNTLVDTGCMK
jgi:hypothetical protein